MAKILIVDDDPQLLTFLTTVMTLNGHEAIAFTSFEPAKQALEKHADIKLFIIDNHVGFERGAAFLTFIRRSPIFRQLPVLICSGDTSIGSIKDFLDLGIQGFLAKPMSTERLRSDVNRVLAAAEASAAAAATVTDPVGFQAQPQSALG